MSIRFASSAVPTRQRNAGGVKGIALQPRDEVVAMDVVDDDGYLLIVGRRGYGKLSLFRHYRPQKRAGKGLITLKVTPKTGRVAAAAVVSEEIRIDSDGKLFLLTEKAQVLRTNVGEIRSTGRNAQGVKIVLPEAGDSISSIRVIQGRREEAGTVDPETLDDGNGAAVASADDDVEPDDGENGENGDNEVSADPEADE